VSGARQQLADLYTAAIGGANIESLTANALTTVPLERRQRVWVFAFGKAAHTMAGAAVTTLQRALAEIAGGVIVAPDDVPPPVGTIAAMVGDHPIPGRRSFTAATRLQDVLTQKRRTGDLGIVLLSGGASSLLGAPLRGMNESDISQLFELLLTSGLDIHEMNAVRKRFALWGAGRMALALAPAPTYCFAVSDVPGDSIASIGSGPCVPDPTRVTQVIDILQRVHLYSKISSSLRQYLVDSARGVIPDTPKASHPAFAHVTARVVANNTSALNAAAAAARRLGCATTVNEQPLIGDASAAGAKIAETLLALRAGVNGSPTCVIWGGETTVAVKGTAPAGGRCQELALAAAKRLADAGELGRDVVVLAAGTDGRDGVTDAAGAIVDNTTWSSISKSGRDPAAALKSHDSYDALAAVDALFKPGLTGTNVMDIVIGVIRQ
jgi:glycerate 2-kinase